MPSQLYLLEAAPDVSVELLDRGLSLMSSRTEESCLILPPQVAVQSFADLAERHKVRHLCLSHQLLEGEGQKVAWGLIRYQANRQRSQAAIEMGRHLDALRGKIRLSSRLILQPETLHLLSPTLAAFEEMGLPWVILDARVLNPKLHGKKIEEAFEWLRIRQQTSMRIYFFPDWRAQIWDAWTGNPFKGPERVDIDVANSCTHNCVFCGMYSPEAIAGMKQRNNGKIAPDILKSMALKVDRDQCLSLIRSLPHTVEKVQFGGIGDPLTHPNAIEFIVESRRRGFGVEVLSNFSYLDEEKIEALGEVSDAQGSLQFIVNLSAAHAETYVKVRPNQKVKDFDNVLQAIRRAREKGIFIVLMSVVQRLNFSEMPDFVQLGQKLGVNRVWLKPMELHGSETQSYLIPEDEFAKYRAKARECLNLSQKLGVELFSKGEIQAVVDGK